MVNPKDNDAGGVNPERRPDHTSDAPNPDPSPTRPDPAKIPGPDDPQQPDPEADPTPNPENLDPDDSVGTREMLKKGKVEPTEGTTENPSGV